MTDPDVVAVRELPPGVTEPTDASVARTWHTMTRRQAAPARRRPARRWVPAAAAVLVAGVAAGGVVLLPDRGAGPAVEVGGAPTAPPTGKADAGGGPNAAGPTSQPVSLGPSEPIDAAHAIDTLIGKVAGSTAQTLRPGQLVYTRMSGATTVDDIGDPEPGRMVRDESEIWYAPEGMSAKAITRNGVDMPPGESRPVDKPSIWQPTPAWLAGLPTEPAALRTELLVGIGDNKKWTGDHLLAKELGELLASSEPLLTGAVRVTMLKMIKGFEGLSARETVFDDQRVWALRQTEQGRFDEILFDPATGRAVGRASGEGDTVSYQVLWTHKLVAVAGAR
ncbi:hypothetical protein [Asanoa sp. NPDC050611]|uniref:hypothetical protein n=1 Tax=Asanoa sp. NPDC050611 TaxID=3157098 RepID=UPI0033FE2954